MYLSKLVRCRECDLCGTMVRNDDVHPGGLAMFFTRPSRARSSTHNNKDTSVIDSDGFRPNVGIIIANDAGRLLWARRVGGQDAWQFPQGGINANEKAEDALFRELYEEVGLAEQDVDILGCTRGWLRYRLPNKLIRRNSKPLCIGQKQKWFLLKMNCDDSRLDFSGGDKPEFDYSRWVSYWYPLGKVVAFKREVYRRALKELAPAHSRLELELDL